MKEFTEIINNTKIDMKKEIKEKREYIKQVRAEEKRLEKLARKARKEWLQNK